MKVVAQNRKARFDLEIIDTLEAGMILNGPEVKSCRMGHISLAGSYVSFLHDKPILKNAKISLYTFSSGIAEYNPERDRQLLLKENERRKLQTATEEKGITVVPLEVRAGKYIKILLGLGRGRKKHDKRQRIKEREVGRKLREGHEV